MHIHLLAVGTRMPAWVSAGYEDYARRLPAECRLHLREVPLARRHKSSKLDRLREEEGRALLAAVPRGALVIALEVGGQAWTTPQLADHLADWMQGGRDVALLVGGPDGLAPACLAAAERRWSLSPLTLPHPLVRLVVAEQIYRAHCILRNHPYHRE
ncbi:MAG TPA: 23S rRNA (pseudouridine(1915)-N(3))-methyltransferase RlmH [Gammaproteobacteria bacterium]|nr:23S rRNA (pseudouridine(1915)-N(3))-methyltransferase RlmH [Gammaproteobacteria bacterium]